MAQRRTLIAGNWKMNGRRADGLALAGGFSFALTNVLLLRLKDVPAESRVLAMFGGGATFAGVLALLGMLQGVVPAVPAPTLAVAGLALLRGAVAETRTPDQRVDSDLGSALRAYALLLRDWHYLGLVFIGATAMAGFFVYLAGSPFVLINHYGLTPAQYSVAFSVNAVAFIGAAQFSSPLGRRFGLVSLVKFAATASGIVMSTMLLYYLLGGDSFWVLVALYFIASAFMGLVIPTTSVLALDDHGAIAGTASALMGTLQMLCGAVAMGVVGLFADGRPLPMVVGMVAGALTGVLLTWITLGGRPRSQAPVQRVVG